MGSQCETVLGSRFGGMKSSFGTTWGVAFAPARPSKHTGGHASVQGVTVARPPLPAAITLAVFKAAPTSMPEERVALADLCTNTVADGGR